MNVFGIDLAENSTVNFMMKKLSLAAVVTILGATGSAALAAPSAWDMPSGDHGTYTYSGGQSANNLFGSGNSFSEGFFFIPTGLRAVANGVGSGNTISIGGQYEQSDTASVILNAKPGMTFNRITSNILGDYTIDLVGSVNSTGTLRVTNLDTSATLSSPLAFGGTVPSSDNDGVFSGDTAIDLPAGWKNIRVEMDGLVSADSTIGSALIQGKDAELGVSTTAEIPLPAAAAVAPVAAYLGWRAKRKLGAAR